MKAVDLEREETLKESRKIYRNLSNRLKRIREIDNAPEYALNRFRELQEKYPRDIRSLSDDELRKYHRELRYINNLKSASVKGVEQFKKNFGETSEVLNVLSPDLKNKFWEIYGKIYEQNQNIDKYKYEVFNTIRETMMFGGNPENLVGNIVELYDKLSRDRGISDDEEFAIRFTGELEELSLLDL